jgi:predicted SnoaL-like aldol condensation-catalyzing enzyme
MGSVRATSRKQDAEQFLELASGGRASEAFERFAAPSFKHHNPHFPAEARPLAEAMEENARQNPDKKLEVQHTIEDGDLVAVHSRVLHAPDAPEVATVHIFRFIDEGIVELWDVAMEAPDESPNELGMF